MVSGVKSAEVLQRSAQERRDHVDIRRDSFPTRMTADSSPRTNPAALLHHLKQQPANKTRRHGSWQRGQGDPAVTLEKASPDGCNRPPTAAGGTGGGNS